MSELNSAQIHIDGIVQGVGFRPFVFNLANRLGLVGWVRNTSAGVDILVDGSIDKIEFFIRSLLADAPPLAHIDNISVTHGPLYGFDTFKIMHSSAIPDAFQPVSPDVSICPDCLTELFDPNDRRYQYPFINCTNCGPRFTIIKDIPYDRPLTTMSSFPMCTDCMQEYNNPSDRRFHAQPIACPICGPHVWFESGKVSTKNYSPETLSPPISGHTAIETARELLAEGKILAIKGLGGFHLACDATSHTAVSELRKRKLRIDKPFGLMMANIEVVRNQCNISLVEQQLLTSHQRPIVILERKTGSEIVEEVAPSQHTLGVMLPYTPLHYLLFYKQTEDETSGISNNNHLPQALVMTSGNLIEEPIAFENDIARRMLAPLADGFLMHNRPINIRCDDSVVRALKYDEISEQSRYSKKTDLEKQSHTTYHIRRSRGYAPFPVQLPLDSQPVLATGSELKNTFCLTRGRYAFISHHIGDMENYETLVSFESGVKHLEKLFRIQPKALAYDLHPDYMASRYALERAIKDKIPAYGIQHHHAHIAACIVDNKLPYEEQIFGVAFDGTGFGQDGALWGGEFLLASCMGYKRISHLDYISLPGGDAAIRKPSRVALAYLHEYGFDWDSDLPPVKITQQEERTAIKAQIEKKINAPKCSSMGRLFDAAASLAGVRHIVSYEAQAAIEFEAIADSSETGYYPFDIKQLDNSTDSGTFRVYVAPALQELITDYRAKVSKSIIASKFHNGVAKMVHDQLVSMRVIYGISKVALSGGVWQNMTLLAKTSQLLKASGFDVFIHHQVPTNDGGISLGQAAILIATLRT